MLLKAVFRLPRLDARLGLGVGAWPTRPFTYSIFYYLIGQRDALSFFTHLAEVQAASRCFKLAARESRHVYASQYTHLSTTHLIYSTFPILHSYYFFIFVMSSSRIDKQGFTTFLLTKIVSSAKTELFVFTVAPFCLIFYRLFIAVN